MRFRNGNGVGMRRLNLLALLLLALCFAPARAQSPEIAPPIDTSSIAVSSASPLNETDVAAWLDGFLPHAMAEADIAGAVVTVVADGRVIANRGYGAADLERRTPVDAQTTLFRPGSISKLFTWTAVMQQVEAGRIDLDADVNVYLDFEIPAYRGQPITMRHIMTHTTGFEEVMRDLVPFDADTPAMSLERYLKTNVPRRIAAPGTMPSYSNYATGLAGYIVQRVSGEAFEDYVRDHIFVPLGMRDSTFAQPLPRPWNARLSSGYSNVASGVAEPFEVIIASPAGALTSTGPDMARFMIAHLHNGDALMAPETARMMHETIDRQFPGVNSMALGFYQENYRGERIIAHGGDTAWFHSNLSLLLDRDVGVFVSFNSSGATPLDAALLRIDLINRFVDRYYPRSPQAEAQPLATARAHGAALLGDFERARRSDTNPIYAAYFASQITITMLPNGDLVGPGLPRPNGQMPRWREVEPWVWQVVGGYERMGARVDAGGQINALAFEPFAFAIPFSRPPWWRSKSLLAPLLGLALAILALIALSWPARAIARRGHGVAFPYSGGRARAHRAAPIASILAIAYLVAWGAFLGWILGSLPNASSAGPAEGMLVALYASNLVLILALALAAFVNFAVWRTSSSWFARIGALFLATAIGIVIWFAVAMNFFSLNLNF